MIEQVGQMQRTIAFFRAPVAQRQQAGQPAPAMARGGIGNNIGRAIGKDQPCADGQPEAVRRPASFAQNGFVGHMCAHHACNGVAVGNAKASHAEVMRGPHHLCRMRSAAQEAVVGGGDKFGKWKAPVHANSPCRYQFGSGFSS